MWFLYSHYDQEHMFFNNKEEALTEYRKWRDNFKKDLRKSKEENGDFYGGDIELDTEMIILSKVIHGIKFNDEKRGGYETIK